VLSGQIMEQYKNKRVGMIKGYRILLYAGVLLTLLFFIARLIVNKEMRKLKKQLRETG